MWHNSVTVSFLVLTVQNYWLFTGYTIAYFSENRSPTAPYYWGDRGINSNIPHG